MRKGTDLVYLLGFCVMLVFVSLFKVFTIVNMMFNFSIKVLLSIKKNVFCVMLIWDAINI